MSTAAELSRERVHVDASGAAERDLHLAVAEIAKEDRHARPGDRAGMLDDPVEILLPHVVLVQRAGSHREPGQPACLARPRACGAPRRAGGSVPPGRRRRRADTSPPGRRPRGQERRRDRVTARRRVAEAESAGVREDRRVERPGATAGVIVELEHAREIVHQLARRARRRVREHDVPRRIVRRARDDR